MEITFPNSQADQSFRSVAGKRSNRRAVYLGDPRLALLGRSPVGVEKSALTAPCPVAAGSVFSGKVQYLSITVDPSSPRVIRISDIGASFLNDFGITVLQYPNRTSLLSHNGLGIICEFGPTDPVNGYQSILLWEPATNAEMQELIRTAIQTGARPPMISELKFPDERVVIRYGAPVEIKSVLQWNALKILASNNSYRGIDLVKHAWANSNKTPPGADEIMDTVYKLISMLNNQLGEHIEDLQLKIVNHKNGYYSLKDLASSLVPSPRSARKSARKPRPKSDRIR